MWGRHPVLAADVAASQNDIIGLVGAVVALALVTTAILVGFRYRRRPSDPDTERAVPVPRPGGRARALPPPPFPETGMTAPITAPGRLQSPKVDPPTTSQVVGLD
ncbi:hypothetical protein HNR73_002860 [Phytomonospora endophytica]|uniref:Uncharacterized protein n=1 Tax=Phytomonospora endophytica TaxID=714109 RepID=A0A841FFG0_9ACTN|nr:hypothetical protein [Phytomonospora endophytica]